MNSSALFFLVYITFGVCYAGTYTEPVTIQCSPSCQKARWEPINARPNSQLTLTTVGMYVTGEGIVIKWDDYGKSIFHEDDARVVARCMFSKEEITMYDLPDKLPSESSLLFFPSLVCPKEEGIEIKFLSPNDPDPNKYVFHATLTVIEDDESDKKTTPKIITKDDNKDPLANLYSGTEPLINKNQDNQSLQKKSKCCDCCSVL